jgi:hypothetical protein
MFCREALQQGMSHKRTAGEAGIGAGSSAAEAAEAGTSAGAGSSKAAAADPHQKDAAGSSKVAAAAAGGPTKRSKVLDSLLDELEGDSSGSSSSEEDGSSSQEGE